MLILDKIKELLEVKYKEDDYSDCYTVDVSQNNTKVEVYIDCDDRLDLGKCQKISRYLESIIDENGWLGEKYTLEVSSPGATRPLIPRQYPKHIGRKVKVKVNTETHEEESKFEGKLESVAESSIVISFIEIERVKKKKIKTEVMKTIDFDDIKEIKVIISF